MQGMCCKEVEVVFDFKPNKGLDHLQEYAGLYQPHETETTANGTYPVFLKKDKESIRIERNKDPDFFENHRWVIKDDSSKTVAYLGLLMFSCPGFLMDKKYDFYHGKGMEKQGSDNGVTKYVDFDKGEFKMQCKSICLGVPKGFKEGPGAPKIDGSVGTHLEYNCPETCEGETGITICQENGEWSQVLGCVPLPQYGECCRELTFWHDDLSPRFMNFYGAFLGIWVQTEEKVNDKPVYERLGNRNMHLSFTNVSAYPTPWTMWAGDDYPSGSHIGNIKIGPSDIDCPENNMGVYYYGYGPLETEDTLMIKCGIKLDDGYT